MSHRSRFFAQLVCLLLVAGLLYWDARVNPLPELVMVTGS